MRWRGRFLAYTLFSLAFVFLQLHTTGAIAAGFKAGSDWRSRLDWAWYWFAGGVFIRIQIRWFVYAALALSVSAFVGAQLLLLAGPNRRRVMRGLSGLCMMCIVLLPAFIVREEHFLLWFCLRPVGKPVTENYLGFIWVRNWLVPVYGSIALTAMGLTFGGMSRWRAALVLPAGMMLLYLSSTGLFALAEAARSRLAGY